MFAVIFTIIVTLSMVLVVGVALYYIGVRVWRHEPKLSVMNIHMINAADFSAPRKGWSTPIFRVSPKNEQQKPS